MSGLAVLLTLAMACGALAGEAQFVNSADMKMVRIEAGAFTMGDEGGESDERPVHQVKISRAFHMSACEVTNAQYERFDPKHRDLRGKRGFSKEDDEAVVFVSWNEAVAFCKWLSDKEGRTYRLPTEAEWEYACRAGTKTRFNTGNDLPEAYRKNQKTEWDQRPVPLSVGKTPPNAFGLCDMHGNVEEWCADWCGPYAPGQQTDPIGPAAGDMKVTRGGSHNTPVEYLRSANRAGTLPDDKSWLIGFRVVMADAPQPQPTPGAPAPRWATRVQQEKSDWRAATDMSKPHFSGPRSFVKIPPGSNGPTYSQHNHQPTISACPNGDLLAVWYSTNREDGREMTVVASRLRLGSDQWEEASVFFKAPDRNMTGSALFWDGRDTLYHFNGLEAAGTWQNLALVMRTSIDNGVTWTTRLIDPEHRPRNQVISGTLRTREGFLIQGCDAVSGGNGGTALHISRDGGKTWDDPGLGKPRPQFQAGKSGAWIAGIHAGVVQLADGRLMAFGRGDSINGKMPMSISTDMGATWTYSASPWPAIGGGQRLVLMRLREGPILFCSFTDSSSSKTPQGLPLEDGTRVFGLFAAISEDEGRTWSRPRLVTDGGTARKLDGGAWTRQFTMDATHAEPKGYLAATQSPDGMIHLLSSALHYSFNLAWIRAR